MSLFSHVLKHDSGFAPNPFWNYCTLACCKPRIRRSAGVGDWIVGTGSLKNIGKEKLIYAMKVTEKLSFYQYSQDKRFKCKIPTKGKVEERGDNIYYLDNNGNFMLRKSYHTEKDKKRDLSVDSVLISEYYFYLGRNGVMIPDCYNGIIKNGPGHKCNFDSKLIVEFTNWIESNFQKGIRGDPFDFSERLNLMKAYRSGNGIRGRCSERQRAYNTNKENKGNKGNKWDTILNYFPPHSPF